jgi:2-dehydropantoate 2-reductase
MRFLIVGPGAMGCLFAAQLKRAGFDAVLMDYKKERADQLNENGIHVEGITGGYHAMVPAVTGTPPIPPDVVLVCVKAYHTEAAARAILPIIRPDTAVMTLQNGVGNVEKLSEVLDTGVILGGVTSEGATLLDTGKIRHAGKGETIIGAKRDTSGRVGEIVSALNTAEFEARSVGVIDDLIWGKLIINVGINALTAIARLKNGRLPEIAGTRRIMEAAVKEAVAVADAKNIRLPYPDPIERVIEVCRKTSGNIASMLQDVLKERATEVDFINGAIVAEGALLNIPTPVNATLTALVQAIQSTYHERIQS